MKTEDADNLTDLLDNHLKLLMEHFEAVQILATTRDSLNGDTYDWMRGAGNWWARKGLAQQFIDKDRAQDIGVQVANQLPRDTDGDDWKDA